MVVHAIRSFFTAVSVYSAADTPHAIRVIQAPWRRVLTANLGLSVTAFALTSDTGGTLLGAVVSLSTFHAGRPFGVGNTMWAFHRTAFISLYITGAAGMVDTLASKWVSAVIIIIALHTTRLSIDATTNGGFGVAVVTASAFNAAVSLK